MGEFLDVCSNFFYNISISDNVFISDNVCRKHFKTMCANTFIQSGAGTIYKRDKDEAIKLTKKGTPQKEKLKSKLEILQTEWISRLHLNPNDPLCSWQHFFLVPLSIH